ncbi:MAG: hypothetical protein M3R38_24520, partial [Actinomycetota bacterium]|nr:hypothetical protein [Actinomycetota bacterium]
MAEVAVIYLPPAEGGGKQGVDDFLAAGHSVDELLDFATSKLREPPEGACEETLPDTHSAVLARYAEEADLFHTPDGEAYATFPVGEHRETHAIRSKGLRLWLQRRFYEEFGRPPGAQALQDALGVAEAKALFEGEEISVHVRVAEHEGAIYVDLANDRWEAVRITERGWEIVSDPPVRFRRRKGMLPLPRPMQGSVDALRRFVNVGSNDDWMLLVAWLVQAFRPKGPYPVLIVQGEQGSAKTTTARMLKNITDPSSTPVRTAPRGEHDLVIAANNSWVVTIDNLSGLPPWLSDALCRLSTGGGFGARTLYENDEETLFDATRPVILNGITDVATRADLLDRAINLTLPRIPEEDRKSESELWVEFDRALPGILGGLFDAVGGALLELLNTRLDSLPRMADFALWATAAEKALGWERGSFIEAYTGSREEINELALESDPVAVAVRKLMEGRDEWVGNATDLLRKLGGLADEEIKRTKVWPKQPNHLSARLKRLAPVLRGAGIEVEDTRDSRTGERKKRIFKNGPANDRHHRRSAKEKVGDEGTVPEKTIQEFGNQAETAMYTDGPDDGDDELRTHSKWVLVADSEDLRALAAKLREADLVAVDLETTGLNPRKDRVRLIS